MSKTSASVSQYHTNPIVPNRNYNRLVATHTQTGNCALCPTRCQWWCLAQLTHRDQPHCCWIYLPATVVSGLTKRHYEKHMMEQQEKGSKLSHSLLDLLQQQFVPLMD